MGASWIVFEFVCFLGLELRWHLFFGFPGLGKQNPELEASP